MVLETWHLIYNVIGNSGNQFEHLWKLFGFQRILEQIFQYDICDIFQYDLK